MPVQAPITLDINDVLDIAVSGFAQPGGALFDSRDAMRIDGTSGDVVNLVPIQEPGWWQRVQMGSPMVTPHTHM